MDLDSLRIFVKVADLGSFTRGADQLRVPKSKASLSIRALEEEVGSRLLQRTTRSVRLTSEGERFLARARRLIGDADELESMFQDRTSLRGKVRVDLPIGFARDVLIPRLPELLALHPELELLLSTTDQRVHVVREGFDCVLRVGKLADSGLVARRLGTMRLANYASPEYLSRYGVPATIEDLDRHYLVQYSLSLDEEPTFEYRDGDVYREKPMRALVTVNGTDAYAAACRAGLGIIQAPAFYREGAVSRGELVEVLPDWPCAPLPVSLVLPHARTVPKRVRAVMSWIERTLSPILELTTDTPGFRAAPRSARTFA